MGDRDLLFGDFGAFYDRYVRGVAAFVGGRIREPEVAFDVVGETFARALEHRDRYDPERAPAIAWLLGIAKHLIVDAARRGRVEAASRYRLAMAPVELYDDDVPELDAWQRAELGVALASLPAEQRDAVLRRVVLGQSYLEIATGVACSEQVIRKRVSRGLAAMRATLERTGQ